MGLEVFMSSIKSNEGLRVAEFEKARVEFKNSEVALTGSKKLTDEGAYHLYGLSQQGSVGDCNTSRPGMMRFTAKHQWDAWNALKGRSLAETQIEFIAIFKSL